MARAGRPRSEQMTRYQDMAPAIVAELWNAGASPAALRLAALWLSMDEKRAVLAEALEADRIAGSSLDELLALKGAAVPESDYVRLVIAERLMAATGRPAVAEAGGKAVALQIAAAASPTASPLVGYEPLYRDLAEHYLAAADTRALGWLRRAIVHNAEYHQADDASFGLVDLASGYLQLGELDRGLSLLTRLILRDPGNVWVYRFIATGFGVLDLPDLGARGARRGLEILDETGDPEELYDELLLTEFELVASRRPGRAAAINPQVLEAFEAALRVPLDLSADVGPVDAAALVPELADVPVKRRLRYEDLPAQLRSRAEEAFPALAIRS